MNSEELFETLKVYFSNNFDLMRHLAIHSCWEYIIKEKSIENNKVKLIFFLCKESESKLAMSKSHPLMDITPDLTLFFTEKAILNLIQGNPTAEKYFESYRKLMKNNQNGFEIDNKINKPRLKLWQKGYRKWQKDFKF